MATFASSILKDTTVFYFIESFRDPEMTVHVISHLNYIADGYSEDLPTSLLSSQELTPSAVQCSCTWLKSCNPFQNLTSVKRDALSELIPLLGDNLYPITY